MVAAIAGTITGFYCHKCGSVFNAVAPACRNCDRRLLPYRMQTIEPGDCRELMKNLSDQSIDAVICDPPYPGIKRDYGTWTVPQWRDLMADVVRESRRVLKPSGSAVFILQPNYRKLGSMNLWLWEWMVDTAREWNLIQNVYWYKPDALPLAGCKREVGLLRSSVKYCCWFGPPDCYRDQSAVLVEPCKVSAKRLADDSLTYSPSGRTMRDARSYGASLERGGATPFNLLTMSHSGDNSGKWGHGAGTPVKLAEWWVRYITPPGGTVLDPFAGVASIGVAAKNLNRNYIGYEALDEYVTSGRKRLAGEKPT
jgi:DNA modification methylase